MVFVNGLFQSQGFYCLFFVRLVCFEQLITKRIPRQHSQT